MLHKLLLLALFVTVMAPPVSLSGPENVLMINIVGNANITGSAISLVDVNAGWSVLNGTIPGVATAGNVLSLNASLRLGFNHVY